MKARGATENPPNRFETLRYDRIPSADTGAEDEVSPQTRLLRDPSKSIVATNQSPDIGFAASVNPYRGCEHGCAYCYARPTHEYLDFSAGLDFETQILVKDRAPELLRKKLASKSWKPQVIAFSGVTDAYQPAERHLRITRRCLEVLCEFQNPVALITKSWLVTRDADLLARLAAHEAASVHVSITSLDTRLQQQMEPRASRPSKRLQAIEQLAEAGVPVGVMVGPVVPGLTEHELPAILEAASNAGAGFAGKIVLRLPYGVKELFAAWLERHHPDRKDKVLNRVRSMRGGALYDARYGVRQRGEGIFAQQIDRLFEVARKRHGLAAQGPELSTAAFRRPGDEANQLALFD